MIQFTPAAMEHLRECIEEEEKVRVAVQGGGCSGMSYVLDIETEFDEEDILLDIPGVMVYIDPYSAEIYFFESTREHHMRMWLII
jgi:iron-sulfur cluster assembly protein